MNIQMVLYITGWILEFEAGFLLLPCIVGLIYHEPDAILAYVITAAISFVVGFLMKLIKVKNKDIYVREGFATVALGWIFMSLVGAIPFVLTGDIPNYIDALFETISGLTTTGASILNDVECLTKTSGFWRCFTHWIGGMGVFVFIMAIVPLMGGTNLNLMKAESTGPSVGKLVPRIKDSAKILYSIYFVLTICAFVTYLICKMPVYDAINLAFGTVGTGGYGVLNSSASSYTPAAQWAITIFMILSGVNYAAYFCIIRKQFKEAFDIEEVVWYLLIIFSSAVLIAINVRSFYASGEETLRAAFFQVGSIITTTGFSTADFDLWPSFSKTILMLLMIIGACSGSTGGGFKISRIIILAKTIKREISTMIHPRQVQKIHMDNAPVSGDTLRSTNVYIVVYFSIMFGSLLLVSLNGSDFTTNFSAVIATLNNIGPGFSAVGPTCNFSFFNAFTKIILMLDMLAGRLELYPMLILFAPSCWKKY